MEREGWERIGPATWRIAPSGEMRVPAVLYADEALLADMDEKVREQLVNVTKLPGHAQICVDQSRSRLVALIHVERPAKPEIDRHEHQSRAVRDGNGEGPKSEPRGWHQNP